MRKHYFLLIAVVAVIQLNAQNLLTGWDGNGLTGTASKPNDVGWLNTVSASVPWQVANGSGGCRFRDYNVTGGHTGFTNESDASTVTTRQLMLRYDNNAYSTSTYAFPVTLDGCSTYNFTFDYVCGGSATPPKNLTVGISTTAAATGRLSSKHLLLPVLPLYTETEVILSQQEVQAVCIILQLPAIMRGLESTTFRL